MNGENPFEHILSALCQGDLREAIDTLTSQAAMYPKTVDEGRFSQACNSYELMLDYWSRGFNDEHLQSVYQVIAKELYAVAADMNTHQFISKNPYFSAIYNRATTVGRNWSMSTMREMLEAFVSEMAMTELEPASRRQERIAQIHAAHRRDMSALFDYLFTSTQWKAGMIEPMLALLLSPTIETADQQLIVSAVTLACMNTFDPNKFKLLTTLYSRSTDEAVRQRALVGWALALGHNYYKVFQEQKQDIERMVGDENVAKELIELQIQILYCVNAERDTRSIQESIMPDLLQHNGLSITPEGIKENENSSEDLLHPEEAERRMERLEQSIGRMADMQKAGVDIYFGSFAQMKRFPFFSTISNWFVPFYIEHPALANVFKDAGEKKVIQSILDAVPFCDSDKYSFVLAFSQVSARMPQSVREMLGHGAVVPPEMEMGQEKDSPAFILRIYLQDIYRFFRCFPQRNLLRNPFEYDDKSNVFNYVVLANPIFKGTAMQSKLAQIASYMFKRNMIREAEATLNNYDADKRDFRFYSIAASIMLRHPEMRIDTGCNSVSECLAQALKLQPNDEKTLSGYARAKFMEADYDEANRIFARLASEHPENTGYSLNQSVCLVNMGKCNEALNILFRLDYEHPGETRIECVMARALVGTGDFGKAERIYSRICDGAACMDEDIVNYGLCQWLSGKRKEASLLFARHLKHKHESEGGDACRKIFLEGIAGTEQKLLTANGIGHCEIRLMCDLVYNELLSGKHQD